MSNSNADMLSKPERFWRGRWLPKFLLKHRTVHSPAGGNPRAQNRPRIPFQSEVPASDVTEYSEISDHRSFTGPLRTSPGLNVPPVGAGKDPAPIATGDDQKSAKHYTPINAENVNSSGIEMQVLNHSDTDAIRHGISGNEKGKGKEATAGTLKTSSTPQDNVELPPQPMQSQNVGDTCQEDISSSSVLRDITSMPVVNGEPGPSREESVADAISSHKQHAFASKGHVDAEQSPIGALSPPQDPKRRDIPPKQGPRNSQPDNGSSVIQPQGLPTSKTQDFKGKPEEESQPRQLSQRAFASLRQRIDGHVKLIEGEYKRKNKGVGSNWITVLENGTIVIKCEEEGFTERVQRKVKESEFFKRFPKILVKHDPDAAGTWVAESSEFFTGTLQSNQYPLTGTIGGIVLVDGKPFGLTAAHGIYVSQHMKGSKSESQDEGVKRNRENDDTKRPFSTATRPTKGNREAFTSWDGHTGEVVAYRFSRTLVSNTPFPKNSENFGLSDAADWALVELDGEEIPMNTVLAGWLSPKSFYGKTEKLPSEGNALEMDRDATEELLWRPSPSDSALKPVLVKDILTEGEFADSVPHHDIERVPCILVTPSSVINGSFGYGYSTFSMYGACFSVLRVDLESPLVTFLKLLC
ncbi:hypothetical protein Daus18300_012621 [Diaporthe australafricana]|uniref:Uncharacterized protein n=1 Tax=Diaporthe australafricana TaxID=127596 RepID=A0ABR3W2B9_9PEZI